MRRALAPAVAALLLAAPALAARTGTTSGTVPDALRNPGTNTSPPEPRLTKKEVTTIFLQNDKVADWLSHYPPRLRTTEANYKKQSWTVSVWAGKAGEV